MTNEEFEQEMIEFAKRFPPGATFRDKIPNGDGDYLVHVLGIFDKTNIAIKYYGKHHQWWHYEFYDLEQMYMHWREGWLRFTT